MLISLFDNVKSACPSQAVELTWEELCSALTAHERLPSKESQHLWSPATFGSCGDIECRHCRGVGPHRLKRTVESVCCAAFDVDSPKLEDGESPEHLAQRQAAFDAQVGRATARLEGVARVLASTHSHRPESWRLRVVLQLSRPVSGPEWKLLCPALASKFDLPYDEQTKDASRIFYLPSASEGADVVAEVLPGTALDVDDFLRGSGSAASDRPSGGQNSPVLGGAAPEDLSWDMGALREAVKSDCKEWGKTILDGLPIGRGHGGNHDALLSCLGELARATLRFAPEAVLELLEQGSFAHPGHYGTDPREEFWLMFPESREHWLEARANDLKSRAAIAEFTRRRMRVQPTPQSPKPDPIAAPVQAARDPADGGEQPPGEEKAPEEEHPGFPLTDTGNAERLLSRYRGSFLWSQDEHLWRAWTGVKWDAAHAAALVYECGKETLRSLPVEEAAQVTDDQYLEQAADFARKCESRGGRQNMVELMAREPDCQALPTDFDPDPWALNVGNGLLDLRAMALRERRREDMVSKVAGCYYAPEAAAPTWERFLEEVLPDAEVREYVQRFAGYSLTGDVSEQVFLFLHGEGDNGKSTLCQALLSALGDYGRAGAPDLLVEKRGDAHPTELADVRGSRLVVCQETEQGRAIAEARVKQLTGGDMIKARMMRQDFFEFQPTHKLILSGNHKPRIRGTDFAIWRRVRLVPFDVAVPDAKKDWHLLDKFRAELPGILNWALRGLAAWREQRLGKPPKVMAATAEYRKEADVFGQFVDDCCAVDPAAEVPSSLLYQRYRSWCESSGERPATSNFVGQELHRRGFRAIKGRERNAWGGLRIRDAAATGGAR